MVNTIETELHETLLEFFEQANIGTTNIGGRMLFSACMKYYLHPEKYEPRKITSNMYKELAAEFDRTVENVEKSMRASLTTAWTLGKPEILYGIFADAVGSGKEHATTAKFIRFIAKLLKEKIG